MSRALEGDRRFLKSLQQPLPLLKAYGFVMGHGTWTAIEENIQVSFASPFKINNKRGNLQGLAKGFEKNGWLG